MATVLHPPRFTKRYDSVSSVKATGETYTPSHLARFVANQIGNAAAISETLEEALSLFDPAVGDGELLVALVEKLQTITTRQITVYGFDTSSNALAVARARLLELLPSTAVQLRQESFLDFMAGQGSEARTLFAPSHSFPPTFDCVIANPPYVRTQILGAQETQRITASFGLSGRVDLYHVFLLGISAALKSTGTAGVIVSNRFMTTRGGASIRAALRSRLNLLHIWDMGDTKLFDAAVLPAVILSSGTHKENAGAAARFTSIYETSEASTQTAEDPLHALSMSGRIGVSDGRKFLVKHGTLASANVADDLWRIATDDGDDWLATVQKNSWGTFRDIGKVRVGVKTCADKVFISSKWSDLPVEEQPELLRPLTTHHIAQRFRAGAGKKYCILYPHQSAAGKRAAIDLSSHPKSRAYLEQHRTTLEARTYLMSGGRSWYELWVPQDPGAWAAPKLVFRDISERPTFWMDLDGTIVNGDCYWLTAEGEDQEDLLWLAGAVANSSFIEAFYDHRFNNKLYSGRRRFITQYVELFPLPNPSSEIAKEICAGARRLYEQIGSPGAKALETHLDQLVWTAFGLGGEEIGR